MATVDKSTSDGVCFSSEAMDLLDCFAYGIDEVICRLAQHAAVERAGSSDGVEITAEDIKQAVNKFAQSLKRSELPSDVMREVDAMMNCLASKLEQFK